MNDSVAERLERIEDRQKIEDVIYRYCRSIDRNDLELFRTVFWEEAGFGGGVVSGVGDFAEPLMAALKLKYEVTHHSVGNILVDLRGDLAFVESYATAYHRSFPTRESNASVLGLKWLKDEKISQNEAHDLVVGLRYVDRFEKRSGEWRITLRNLVFDWSQVEVSNTRDFGSFGSYSLQGARGREDISYLYGYIGEAVQL
jgi:SnoaL-like protein